MNDSRDLKQSIVDLESLLDEVERSDNKKLKYVLNLSICLTMFMLSVSLAMSIASYIVAYSNMNLTCDDSTVVKLTTWLIVYASVNLVFIFIELFATMAVCYGKLCTALIFKIPLAFNGLFTLAWNIVGAVVLFRDSMNCLDKGTSLWAMTLTVLIYQWLNICVSCKTHNKSKQ